jgi:hypothetical protein
LRIDVDALHSKYFPLVLEFVLGEAVGTRTIQLRSRYCGQLDLYKKYSREYTDSQLLESLVEEPEDIAKRLSELAKSTQWNYTAKNPDESALREAARKKLLELKAPPKSIDESSNLNESSWSQNDMKNPPIINGIRRLME